MKTTHTQKNSRCCVQEEKEFFRSCREWARICAFPPYLICSFHMRIVNQSGARSTIYSDPKRSIISFALIRRKITETHHMTRSSTFISKNFHVTLPDNRIRHFHLEDRNASKQINTFNRIRIHWKFRSFYHEETFPDTKCVTMMDSSYRWHMSHYILLIDELICTSKTCQISMTLHWII